MGQRHRNLELKVACGEEDLALRRAMLVAAGIPIVADLWQRDIYLRVPHGRKKVRWIVEDRAGESRTSVELITYARPDEASSRWSEYSVQPVALEEVDALETKLLPDHEVLAVVAKQRELAMWGQTRVHLDKVEDLGCFIELESVISDQSDDEARREHQTVIRALRLDELPAVAGSYSDLLLRDMARPDIPIRFYPDEEITRLLAMDARDPETEEAIAEFEQRNAESGGDEQT